MLISQNFHPLNFQHSAFNFLLCLFLNIYITSLGFSLAYGLCSALDTLISQAYGAKAYRLTGLYAQRAAVILTLSSIPVAALW